MTIRLQTREPHGVSPPAIHRDPDVIRGFLEDAAHVPGGHAAGVVFPRDEAEVAAVLRSADRILAVGAQSSLTGGATPSGDIVLSTRALTGIEVLSDQQVRVGAGVPLADLQRVLAARGLYYPPAPTYDGAFVGGTIATNAAGAATYKFGSTRAWVDALTIVLADGGVLDVRRSGSLACGAFEIQRLDGNITRVPVPDYPMPAVPKSSAGYYSGANGVDPIDLFIGSEGTLGVIISAVLRVVQRPDTTLLLIECGSDATAVSLTAALQADSRADIAGIEYMDANSLASLDDDAFERAGVKRPVRDAVLLLAQLHGSVDAAAVVLDAFGCADQAIVAPAGDHRGAERLLALREAVPVAVNRRVRAAKDQIHPDIEKTAGDMIVPFHRLGESLDLYRATFDRQNLRHAIWGHFSDGNLHPNVIPRSIDDVVEGKRALLAIGRRIVEMGGSPLAEHGVGRNEVKQELLRVLHGSEGIEQMRAVKRALDAEWKLAPGVLFPREA